jgi:hypothetical protein
LENPEHIDNAYRKKGVHFYSNARIAKFHADERVLSFQPHLRDRLKNYVLSIQNKEHHSAYAKDDIWIVSKDKTFGSSIVFRSVFYGVSSSASVEVAPFGEGDFIQAQNNFPLKESEAVYCIRVMNAMTEVLLESNLLERLDDSPLLPVLLNGASRGHLQPISENTLQLAQSIVEEFTLNEDQASVLLSFAKSLEGSNGPVTLVHGVGIPKMYRFRANNVLTDVKVFGSGKSYLICVIIVYLHRVAEAGLLNIRESPKVMISSMTNGKLLIIFFINLFD